jgi:quercetin dioxygenase-like cupin family protein
MTSQTADAPAPASAPYSSATAAVIAHAGDGVPVRAFGNELLFKLTTDQSRGALTVGLATVPPGGRVPPHGQDREDELFLIVDGAYRFWVDGEWTEVGPGALVYVPRGVAHTFQTVGDRPGRHWVLSTPGGFDHFFARCAELFAVPGPPDLARLAAINAEYGIRLV